MTNRSAAANSKKINFNMNDSVSAQEGDWVQACVDSAKKDHLFTTFRASPAFQRVIEGTPKSGGIWILRRLLKSLHFTEALPLIQTSDTIGLPLNMIDFSIIDTNGVKNNYSLSPTTMRYANNAINCMSLFDKAFLNGGVEIYEIGGGYGGEAKIFNDFAKVLSHTTLDKKWHVFDLPTSRGLIERFLSAFNYKVSFEQLETIKQDETRGHMVISNGAFSEMTGVLLDEYFDRVIAPAKYGYFITNFEIHSKPHGGWTTDDFISRLQKSGKKDVAILPTASYLSYFDHQAGSKLIVFGHNQTHIRNEASLVNITKTKLMSFFFDLLANFTKRYLR